LNAWRQSFRFRAAFMLSAKLHVVELDRAFNPAALGRQPFLREHHELWLSRTVLLGRYGRGQRQVATKAAKPDEM